MTGHYADQPLTSGSVSAVESVNVKEGMQRSDVNNALRAMVAMVKNDFAANAGTITASATFNLASISTGDYVLMAPPSGASITSFGAATEGLTKLLEATGTILVRNSSNLSLPASTDITLAAGDLLWARAQGSSNWKARIFKNDGTPVVPSTNGKHKLWIPANAMTAHPTFPPAFATVVATDFVYNTWDCDQASIEVVFFTVSMPSSWNEGTVTFVPVWTAAAGSGDVIWQMQAVAKSNDDAIATAASASVTSTDTLLSTGDLHRGPESSALTIDGTPAANDTVFFLLFRNASAGGDTLNADARLLGIEFYLTTDAAVDVP